MTGSSTANRADDARIWIVSGVIALALLSFASVFALQALTRSQLQKALGPNARAALGVSILGVAEGVGKLGVEGAKAVGDALDGDSKQPR